MRLHRAFVPEIAAAIEGRVGIEDLAPAAGARHADAVVLAWRRSEIAHHQDRPRCLRAEAQEREDRVGAIIADHPAKTFALGVARMQRGLGAIEAIEIAEEPLHAGMRL